MPSRQQLNVAVVVWRNICVTPSEQVESLKAAEALIECATPTVSTSRQVYSRLQSMMDII